MDFLHDPDVETARAHGGVVALAGGRSLRLPSVFGFCGGVMRALTLTPLLIQIVTNPSR